eukprot:CAMPEP_0174263776 /NCGR_PEP_ID=MMETSP0439-20130205/19984_1 /TAXON_ID=0 /ORGANISM="Stereomyxa ramosa, Strain Chinc5" /LENGTH=276 /DNA_ID=CAMNT_0015349321 /DNA_START=1309 /DNA_END=2139 /DNA_ORIENTATION=-
MEETPQQRNQMLRSHFSNWISIEQPDDDEDELDIEADMEGMRLQVFNRPEETEHGELQERQSNRNEEDVDIELGLSEGNNLLLEKEKEPTLNKKKKPKKREKETELGGENVDLIFGIDEDKDSTPNPTESLEPKEEHDREKKLLVFSQEEEEGQLENKRKSQIKVNKGDNSWKRETDEEPLISTEDKEPQIGTEEPLEVGKDVDKALANLTFNEDTEGDNSWKTETDKEMEKEPLIISNEGQKEEKGVVPKQKVQKKERNLLFDGDEDEEESGSLI